MGPTKDSTNASTKVKSYSIPRLAADRLNWIIWKQQTLSGLMSNKGIQRHLEGMAHLPQPSLSTLMDTHSSPMRWKSWRRLRKNGTCTISQKLPLEHSYSLPSLEASPLTFKAWKLAKSFGILYVINMRKGHSQLLWTYGTGYMCSNALTIQM